MVMDRVVTCKEIVHTYLSLEPTLSYCVCQVPSYNLLEKRKLIDARPILNTLVSSTLTTENLTINNEGQQIGWDGKGDEDITVYEKEMITIENVFQNSSTLVD